MSTGIYASLNCGAGSGDDYNAVKENRARALRHFGATEANLCMLYQIHSDIVVTVKRPWSTTYPMKADAMVTDVPGIVLGILTADCAPILFADRHKPIIGAAHAGWKGALGGVLEHTLEVMRRLGAEDIVACIGPCIARDSYEVGQDFFDAFVNNSADNDRFFTQPPASCQIDNGAREKKYRFDLPGYVAHRLRAAGVAVIEHISQDTYAEEKKFFSYRRACHRGNGDYGRQLSAISLKKD